jgi:hypothetical protein
MTWPVLIRPTGVFYGLAEDPLLFQWMFWYTGKAGGGWFLSHVPIIGYPGGVDLSFWPREILVFFPGKVLTWAFGQTVAYNILILLSFFLSGVFMYCLVRHLTRNRVAAFVCGLAWAFCPNHVMHALVHVNLAGIQWIPLFFLFFFRLLERKDWKNTVYSGLTFGLVAWADFHYAVFVALLAAVILVALAVQAFYRLRPPRLTLIAALKVALLVLIAVAMIAPVALPLAAQQKNTAFARRKGSADLVKFSSRPWDYVLPTASNPILGKLTRTFIYSHLHGAEEYEAANYLGIVLIILAFVGAFAVLKRRTREGGNGELPAGGGEDRGFSPERRSSRVAIAWSMIAGAFLFFLISLPPYFNIGGVRIYLPSYLVHAVFPLFRSFSRFGLMTLFCIVILAGYGVKAILDTKWLTGRSISVAIILAALILFEFTIVPPFKYTEVKPPPAVFTWLAKQDSGKPVACYPMDQRGWYVYKQLFGQTVHARTMINAGGLPNGVNLRYQYVMDYLGPYTPGVLASLGVRQIVVIPSWWNEAVDLMVPGKPYPDLLSLPLPDGYRKARITRDGFVLDVTASAARVVPQFVSGFSEPRLVTDTRYYQQCGPTGKVLLDNKSSENVIAPISFNAFPLSGATNIELILDGRKVGRWTLGETEATITTSPLVLHPGAGRFEIRMTQAVKGSGKQPAVMMSGLTIGESPGATVTVQARPR